MLLKPLGTPVWHGPIGFGASRRLGLRAFAELVVVGSAHDLVTRGLSRETESGLRYKMLTRSDGHHPSDTRGPKCEKLPS